MKKKKHITIDAIRKQKSKFAELTEKSIEQSKQPKQSPARVLLNEVKDDIQNAVENGVAIKTIADNIRAVFGYKISPATVRKFVVDDLGLTLKKASATKTVDHSKSVDDFLKKMDD